jgi:hypothetical protein
MKSVTTPSGVDAASAARLRESRAVDERVVIIFGSRVVWS